MPAFDRVLTQEVSWSRTLEPGAKTSRENSGCWRRGALEVRKVRNLKSRVALQGVSGGSTSRDSTGDETTCGKQKDLATATKGGWRLSPAHSENKRESSTASTPEDKSLKVFQGGNTALKTTGSGTLKGHPPQAVVGIGGLFGEVSDPAHQHEYGYNPPSPRKLKLSLVRRNLKAR
ncbi:hypothetical protein NDU88_005180 [Pleurodeles waltl]|uniref:Uncharacterized protein n=1 Tax=Pleurodeles waltl TaxID=8319 RepID=A0AAV7MVJ0_PLEWA|nr:hypothetical protein NDU88_005180 [Pleurodeles waltl]